MLDKAIKLPSRRALGREQLCSAINADPHLRGDDVMKLTFCLTFVIAEKWPAGALAFRRPNNN